MKINKKEFVDARIKLVDTDTQEPIEASFENISITSSDEGIVSVNDVNADGEADIVGISAGTASLHITAGVRYTDKNGEQVVTAKETDVEVVVSQDAQKTELVVTFTDAQPVPDENAGNGNPE